MHKHRVCGGGVVSLSCPGARLPQSEKADWPPEAPGSGTYTPDGCATSTRARRLTEARAAAAALQEQLSAAQRAKGEAADALCAERERAGLLEAYLARMQTAMAVLVRRAYFGMSVSARLGV